LLLHNFEGRAHPATPPPSLAPHPHRDLAALQLVEAAEAAMRLAHSPEKHGPGSPRAFDMLSVIDDVIAEAGPKACALGVSFVHAPRGGDPPLQVTGESVRLRQILSKLVCGALEARGIAALRLTHQARRMEQQLVFDVSLRLQRRNAASSFFDAAVEPDEVDADQDISLTLSPALLTAAVGGSHEAGATVADLSVALRLRLPLASSQPAVSTPLSTGPSTGLPAGPFDESALRGLRLLLVEDLDLNREMVGMLLSPFGCELSEATNGVEAVNAIEAEPYDAILMDLQLPEMDGFEAIRRIRAREDERARTPILAVSGRVMAADIAQARAAGADGHLSKPYTSQDLVAAILKCRRDAGTED
jgi:CheY-like chemotaxis protein